jgi:hypothetical protein
MRIWRRRQVDSAPRRASCGSYRRASAKETFRSPRQKTHSDAVPTQPRKSSPWHAGHTTNVPRSGTGTGSLSSGDPEGIEPPKESETWSPIPVRRSHSSGVRTRRVGPRPLADVIFRTTPGSGFSSTIRSLSDESGMINLPICVNDHRCGHRRGEQNFPSAMSPIIDHMF